MLLDRHATIVEREDRGCGSVGAGGQPPGRRSAGRPISDDAHLSGTVGAEPNDAEVEYAAWLEQDVLERDLPTIAELDMNVVHQADDEIEVEFLKQLEPRNPSETAVAEE